MKYEIEFHDSEITSVKINGNELRIFFENAVLIVTHPEKGWIQKDFWIPCELRLSNASDFSIKKGMLFDGEISGLGGVVPIHYHGVDGEVVLHNQDGIHRIKASVIDVIVDDEDLPNC